MYAYLKGSITQRREEFIVIEVAGIGYKVFCLPPIQSRFAQEGNSICVYTHLYVREDTMALYGFPSQEEHDMFLMLLQVSGIGPKVALALVAHLPPSRFALAVITGDIACITQVKGVGKKGAERLVLELKDKLKGFAFDSQEVSVNIPAESYTDETGDLLQEAAGALVVLGYSPMEARKAVSSVYQEGMLVEELIRLSLRALV